MRRLNKRFIERHRRKKADDQSINEGGTQEKNQNQSKERVIRFCVLQDKSGER